MPPGRSPRRGRPGGAHRRAGRGLALALALAAVAAGCARAKIVPVPGANVRVDPAEGTAVASADGVELAVRPSSWRGAPWGLSDAVTPFHVRVTNGAAVPISFDHPGFRLFDDARFQYTALPPVEVERILRSRVAREVRVASAASPPPVLRRRVLAPPYAYWPWWGWDPFYYDPWYYTPPRLDEIYLRALPVGLVQPGARVEGFVYFPRLRPNATALTLEFHHWLGQAARVLVLPFAIQRSEGGAIAAS